MGQKWSPAEEETVAYWEALLTYALYAQATQQSILAWPSTEKGLELLGDYYTATADMLSPVFQKAAEKGAMNVLLIQALITSAHMKEIEREPRSRTRLYNIVMQNKPETLTDELWEEIKRIEEIWKMGYFQPGNYPITLEQVEKQSATIQVTGYWQSSAQEKEEILRQIEHEFPSEEDDDNEEEE